MTETLPVTGYDLTNLVCNSTGTGTSDSENIATGVSTITLGAGGSVTCTYTNTAAGLDHDRQGHGAQRHPGLRLHRRRHRAPSFTLDDDGVNDGLLGDISTRRSSTTSSPAPTGDRDAARHRLRPDQPGLHSTGTGTSDSENIATGVRPSPWRRRLGDLHLSRTPARGSITIVKDTVPNGTQTSPTPTTRHRALELRPSMTTGSTTASSATSSARRSSTTSSPAPTGDRDAARHRLRPDQPGLQLDRHRRRDGGIATGVTRTITLDAGGSVTCTYTNTKPGARSRSSRTRCPTATQDFAYTTNGTGLRACTLDDDGVTDGLLGDILNTKSSATSSPAPTA